MNTEPLAALYFDESPEGFSVGVAMIEPYGFKGWICEIAPERSHPYGAIDRALHLLFVSGSRRLLIGAVNKRCFDEIAPNFAMYDYEYSERFLDLHDQNILFKKAFALRSLLSPIEHLSLETRPLSAQALGMLVHTIYHPGTPPLAVPSILNTADLMELGNNALEQLEITVSDWVHPSIAGIFLTMATPMGKRLGRFRLFMPVREEGELNRRYDLVQLLRPHAQWLSVQLREIGDLELLWWRLQNQDGSPQRAEDMLRSIRCIAGIEAYFLQHRIAFALRAQTPLDEWEGELALRYSQRQWIEEQREQIGAVIEWIARIDVAVTSAILADKYALTRPAIVSGGEGNFLQLMGVRHLLVEEQGVTYVPNDIVMGDRECLDLPYPSTVMLDPHVHDGATVNGVLLYGINSSGKSSLMKSIGIAVVLAQAGFFVPARSMKFSLFEGVYTRILSRDNVAKSLSTFGVEMLELNTIFSRATPRSLVLGDEISHGTETLSAVAIVASTIIELARREVLFLMTTHLHQLSMVRELSRLRGVVNLHLSVRYDENSDRLVYDRILKSGRGSSVYGLEFAESLHMDERFLEGAKRLREELAKEYDVLELAHQKEYIRRYRDVSACECVICGALIRNPLKAPASKEHHNLIPLCERDRRRLAEGKIKPRGLIMTPQGLRLEYETQL